MNNTFVQRMYIMAHIHAGNNSSYPKIHKAM